MLTLIVNGVELIVTFEKPEDRIELYKKNEYWDNHELNILEEDVTDDGAQGFTMDYQLDDYYYLEGYGEYMADSGIWSNGNVSSISFESGFEMPSDSSYLFANAQKLEVVDIKEVDTINVENMAGLFSGCISLKEVDLSGFDTQNVIDMSEMFKGCECIKELNLDSFNTSKVIKMVRMFYGCKDLIKLNISEFDTQNVNDMWCMFYECKSIETLDLTGFDTQKVTMMNYMFGYCKELKELDLCGFDLSSLCDKVIWEIIEWGDCCGDYSESRREKCEYNDKIFYGCDNLDSIITPVNCKIQVDLPYCFVDNGGVVYTDLINSNTSITLQRILEPIILNNPKSQKAYIGGKVELYVEAGGSSMGVKNECQWQKSEDGGNSWQYYDDENERSLLYITVKQGMNGWQFRCMVTNKYGTIYSEPATITALSNIIDQPKSILAEEGENVTFSLKPRSNKTYKYCWQISDDGGKNWLDSSKYGIYYSDYKVRIVAKAEHSSYLFRCRLDVGHNFEYSDEVLLTVVPKSDILSIIEQPSGAEAYYGDIIKITTEVTGTDNKYQWMVSCDDGENWEESGAAGNKTKQITIKATKGINGRKYKCIISNEYYAKETNIVDLKTKSLIKSQAVNQQVAIDDYAKFNIVLAKSNVKLQWQVSDDGGKKWENSNASGNTTTKISFKVNSKKNGYLYRCKVINGSAVEYSKVVSIKVKPKIIIQPKGLTVKYGDKAKFTVNAVGISLKYQWEVSCDGGKKWKISNALGNNTSTLYIIANANLNGRKFRCKITSGSIVVYSDIIQLTTKSVIVSSPIDVTVKSGTTARFSVKTSSTNLKYQWQISIDGGKTWRNSGASGSNTKEVSISARTKYNGYMYRCMVTNGTIKMLSKPAKLIVK